MKTQEACKYCRTMLLPGQPACGQCGKPVEPSAPSRRPCPRCGHQSDVDARFCPSCGESMEQEAPRATDARPEQEPEASKVWVDVASGRRVAIVLGLVFGGLLVLTVVFAAVRSTFFGPEAAVRDHFSALADRDAAGALDTLAPDNDGAAPSGPLLRADALRHAAYRPPTGLEITDIRDAGDFGEEFGNQDSATAVVRYRIGDRQVTQTINLVRDDKSTWLFFHRWRLRDGVGLLQVSAPGSTEVLINGAAVRKDPDGEAYDDDILAAAFPGEYTVRLPDNPLLEAAPVAVSVTHSSVEGSRGDEAVALRPTIKASAFTEINTKVRSYLDECARSTEPSPRGCPFSIYGFFGVSGEVSDVKWQIGEYPQVTVTMSEDNVPLVSTTTPGTITGSGTEEGFFDENEPFSEEFELSADGTVQLVNGQIQFFPRTGE